MRKLKVLFLIMCMFIPFLIAGCGEDDSAMKVPANLSAENGRIIFDAVKDAEYYNISINELTFDIYVDKTYKASEADGKVTYRASDILEYGNTYNIKVKACHKERGDSEYSEPIEYRHYENLKDITGSQINNKIISWSDVKNASEYELKIVTPNDSVILDKDGNVLDGKILDIIERANVATFTVNGNQFNFVSLISSAGKYSFYARAKHIDGENVYYSKFTNIGNYENFIKIDTPKILAIEKSEDELHMIAKVDKNANQVTIECAGFISVQKLTDNENIKTNANVLDINLSKVFKKDNTDTRTLNINDAKAYSFSISAEKETTSSVNYYIDSEQSEPKSYSNIVNLYAPTNLTVSYQEVNNTFVAKWDKSLSSHQYIAGYKLYVATSIGVEEHMVNASTRECLIGSDVIAVAISTIGVNNYYKSNISEFVQNPTLTQSISGFNASANATRISWNNVANYYIVILNDEMYTMTTNSFNIELFMADQQEEIAKVIAVKTGYKVNEKTVTVNMKNALATPTTVDNVTTYYDATINLTQNVNAMGFYVYVSKNGVDYRLINEMFTSPTINLANYIAMDDNYKIKIQAVASPYGIYENSAFSETIVLALPLKLDSPKLYKVNNEVKPVVEENGKKYLYFYGVEDSSMYEVLVNYNLKIVSNSSADENGLFKIDITNYLNVAGDILVKVKAISAIESYKDSDYAEYIYSQTLQLNKPINLRLSEAEGVYTLSFDEVEHATAYKVNITNPNRDIYSFEVTSTSIDVTQYIAGQGECYIFITAISSNEAYKESALARLTVEIK